jgi:hypothetical protein
MGYALWYSLHRIVSDWVDEHPDLIVEELVDDLHDYIVEQYGPPF